MSEAKGRSLEVPGISHGKAPIPMGARVGNVIYSSAIMGRDPANDSLPGDASSQTRFAFENMQSMLEAGGASLDALVRMTVHVVDESVRGHVNQQWLKYFPDPHDRPARHVVVHDLPGGMLVQLEVVAIVS